LLTSPRAFIPDSITLYGLVDKRTDLLLWLALELIEKLLESPLLLNGLSGYLIELTILSMIAGYRSRFCRELITIKGERKVALGPYRNLKITGEIIT